MPQFTLVQLGAFNAVAKYKSYTRAAKMLKKDRKTVSEQIETLEITFGYALFEKQARGLQLTTKGEKLFHRAQLLWADVVEFESFAMQMYDSEQQKISVCYDETIPADWLLSLRHICYKESISLDLIKVSRERGEQLLRQGRCQFGLFLAKGCMINSTLYWKALPPISVSVFAASYFDFFNTKRCKVSRLAKAKQRVYYSITDPYEKYPLLVSDNYIIENDLYLLIEGLLNEPSWAFLPNHLVNQLPSSISRVNVDVTGQDNSFQLQPVILWTASKEQYLELVLTAIDRAGC